MDKLDAMRMFARVVECGSFSQAARDLKVSQPTVSKQLAALETRLGTQLLARNSRTLAVTPAGQEYYEATVRVLQDIELAEERALAGQSAPSGLVRVSSSPAFGRMYMLPRLSEFRDRFPDVAIEMDVCGRHVDLIEEGFDVAIRIGHLSDSALVVRHIGDMRMITVASALYLAQHGIPQTIDDLRTHQRISYVYKGDVVRWRFDVDGEIVSFDGSGAFRTNDADHIRGAVLAHLGIAHIASWLFSDVLATGEVIQILDRNVPPTFPIHAVTVAGRRMPSRVRQFVDFLATVCAEEPELRVRG